LKNRHDGLQPLVLFDGSARHQRQLMDVKIERTGSFTLYGDPAVVNL
jgi:hypothetical protein